MGSFTMNTAFVFLVLGTCTTLTFARSDGEMKIVWLNETAEKPRCIDGSSAAMYISPGSDNNKFVVWLEGGGLCESLDDCKNRSATDLGSSNNYQATRKISEGFLSSDPKMNPDFHNWNRIFVPYCSGDVWDGRAVRAMNPWAAHDEHVNDNWSGYFQGHVVVDGVLNATRDLFGLASATDVILTGCSAGGIGTFVNCDFVADYMKKFPNQNTNVACRPEAGYFGLAINNYPDFVKGKTDTDLRHLAISNWTITIDPWTPASKEGLRCIRDVTSGALKIDHCEEQVLGPATCCSMVPILYPYIQTPVFVSENTADSYQVFPEGGAPETNTSAVNAYIEYLRAMLAGSLMSNVMNGVKKDTDGMFAPACLRHCMLWQANNSTIDGRTHATAFGDWYFHRNNMNMSLNPSTQQEQLRSCTDTNITLA